MTWLEDLTSFAQGQLGEREYEALWARGVSDEQIQLYQLGYLNKTLPPLGQDSLVPEFLKWCWHGKRLEDMFVLPLTNSKGQIKGFQFRHVDRTRRGWLDYFSTHEEPVLFGLGQAMPHIWSTESVWVVEGGFDVFPIQRVYPQVLSTMTSYVTDQTARLLRRLATDFWMAYDTDLKGKEATAKFAKAYQRSFRVHSVALPVRKKVTGAITKDPSDLWEALGDAEFGVYLRSLQTPF